MVETIAYRKGKAIPINGVMERLPAPIYHAIARMSKHNMEAFAIAPKLYQHRQKNPLQQTEAMWRGSLIDMAIFEPKQFRKEVATIPKDMPPRPTKAQMEAKNPKPEAVADIERWKEFLAKNQGKDIISQGEKEELDLICEAAREHPSAKLIFGVEKFLVQPSIFWADTKTQTPCKCRLDYIAMFDGTEQAPDIILDLKSAISADAEDFSRAIYNFRYDVQTYVYPHAWKQATGREAVFVFLVVEKKAPYLNACYKATPRMRESGEKYWHGNLKRFVECQQFNYWPSYNTTIEDIDLPPWVK